MSRLRLIVIVSVVVCAGILLSVTIRHQLYSELWPEAPESARVLYRKGESPQRLLDQLQEDFGVNRGLAKLYLRFHDLDRKLQPGEYKISAKFADKHIEGSPFTCKVTGEGKKRNAISVGSSSDLSLPDNLSSYDLRSLNAYIIAPSGAEEPCFLKKLPKEFLVFGTERHSL